MPTLEELISIYKEHIRENGLKDEAYKWTTLAQYKGRPNLDNPNLLEEFRSINYHNLVYPIGVPVIHQLARQKPDDYRKLLKYLFDESIELEIRIKTFMTEIAALYRDINPDPKHSSHHDERTIATFLTFRDPEKYVLFKDSFYRKYCAIINTKPKKKGEKYVHHLDLLTTFIEKYVKPDQELIDLVQNNIPPNGFSDPTFTLLAQDLLYQTLDKLDEESDMVEESEEESIVPESLETLAEVFGVGKQSFLLNQILFGPPGTGKTFNTINKSLEILGLDLKGMSRSRIKEIFNQKIQEGQIVFTTFHQSLSYEDFIEGIKPVVNEKEGEGISYKIEPGIFKRLCTEAAFSIAQSRRSGKTNEVLTFSYKYDQYIGEIEERLARNEPVTLPTKTGGDVIVESISPQGNFVIKHTEGSRTYTVSKARLSKLRESISDLKEVTNINEKFRSIIGGSNASAYWAVLNALEQYRPSAESSTNFKTYSREEKEQVVIAMSSEEYKTDNPEPYILIIDEINRGNVSQIFGELITLIEEDKRLGRSEMLEVTLPYSKEKFGVPPNIYILGTMNTADRSVEALDAALRRRFSFTEMPPKAHLLATDGNLKSTNGIINDIDLALVLTLINKRIEKLIDRDHQIGHSYFLGVSSLSDLKTVFKNKIIPLLQEYFFGDYAKIGLVLGNQFVKPTSDYEEDIFAAFDSGDGNDFISKSIYSIVDAETMTDDQFVIALQGLLNRRN